MKNLYAVLLLVCCALTSNAQIVNIPDPYFKNLLVNTHCTDTNWTGGSGVFHINGDVDTNNDGEIQLSEAQAVKVLEFDMIDDFDLAGLENFTNLEFLYFVYFNFSNLDLSGVPWLKTLALHTGSAAAVNLSGLTNLNNINAAFVNFPETDFSGLSALEDFSFWESSFPSLDLSNLSNLKSIYTTAGPDASLTTVNVSGLTNLESLTVSEFGLTSLDLSDLVNLKGLSCYDNQLTSLDLSHNNLLTGLECNNNLFTSLEISNLTQLTSLNCGDNQLTNLDVTHSPLLEYLHCYNNQLTDLDLSNGEHIRMLYCGSNQLTALDASHLLQLGWIGANGNLFTELDLSYSQWPYWEEMILSDNPNLTYLNVKNGANMTFPFGNIFSVENCPNLRYICADEMNFYRLSHYVTDAQVSSYCSFTPGGAYNTISGKLTFDLNDNGCDAGDVLSLNSKMKITSNTGNGVTFANATGDYAFYTAAGNFTVSPDFENPYFTVSPASALVNFPTMDSLTQTQDFCITRNGIHNDVEITIVPTRVARPGFDTDYRLVFKNKGSQTLSGDINFTFDDTVLDVVSTAPAASQSLNNLSWAYSDLLPFESRSVYVSLNVNSPQETPSVNIGDILNFSASINPVSGDETIADNSFILNEVVRGSFDPNDKTCLEGDTMTPEQVGKYLHYLIRFQNSGTAPAENIVVKDIIDTEKYEISSLELVSSSHPHQTRISGNKVEFIFEGINLPTESEDEPASHGYVAFKIKTKENLVLGNEVSNIADIYFDYNFPITTAPATTTVALLGKNNFEDKTVSVYPNPVQNKLQISAKDNIHSVQLFDLQGRLIRTATTNNVNVTFDMSGHATGVYFVKIHTGKGVKTEKIIKE